MIPMRSEQEEGTGVTFATGRPRLVTRMPSAGSPSNNCRHCSRKSLTLKLFIPQVYRLLYISAKSLRAFPGRLVPAARGQENTGLFAERAEENAA